MLSRLNNHQMIIYWFKDNSCWNWTSSQEEFEALGVKRLRWLSTTVPVSCSRFLMVVWLILQCDGQYIPLPSLQGIAVLNIPSYAGGTNFWGGTKEDDVSDDARGHEGFFLFKQHFPSWLWVVRPCLSWNMTPCREEMVWSCLIKRMSLPCVESCCLTCSWLWTKPFQPGVTRVFVHNKWPLGSWFVLAHMASFRMRLPPDAVCVLQKGRVPVILDRTFKDPVQKCYSQVH